MFKRSVPFILAVIISFPVTAQTYITNVTVADVEKQRMIPAQTVVITGDKISKIQSARQPVPAGANTIDGTGKYLFPGLTDAHIHFFQSGGLYTRPDVIDLRNQVPYAKEVEMGHEDMENKMRRYLQKGITNVVDVGASYNYLDQRKTFSSSWFAPSVYMTGPLLTTYQPPIYENLKNDAPFSLVKTIDDGIKMVREQLKYGPDFIKIWYIAGADGLGVEESARKNLPVIKAIINEAHKNNLKVAVHATERITAQLAVENGADFLVHSIEDEVIKDDFVQLLKKNYVILCPTLTVLGGYTNTLGQNLKISNRDLKAADPFQLGSLLDLRHLRDTARVRKMKAYLNSPEGMAKNKKDFDITLKNLKKLSDAGVVIASGTDAGNIGTLHASSYLAELLAMQQSGMSNWQIIQASTINGAKVLSKENEFGSVAVNKKANLILLNANPLDNLSNIENIYRVINRGVVIDPDTLIRVTPAILAQQQLNAYNLRNIDAFLEPYADNVEVFRYPDKLIMKGKEEMRKSYTELFQSTPGLHCELVGRIVQGNIVIDKERVKFDDSILEAVAIYHVEKGRISKVYFIQ